MKSLRCPLQAKTIVKEIIAATRTIQAKFKARVSKSTTREEKTVALKAVREEVAVAEIISVDSETIMKANNNAMARRRSKATTTRSSRTVPVVVEAVVANVKIRGKTVTLIRSTSRTECSTILRINDIRSMASIQGVITISKIIVRTRSSKEEDVVVNATRIKIMIVNKTQPTEVDAELVVDNSDEAVVTITAEMMNTRQVMATTLLHLLRAIITIDSHRTITGVVVVDEVLNGIINKTARQPAKVKVKIKAIATTKVMRLARIKAATSAVVAANSKLTKLVGIIRIQGRRKQLARPTIEQELALDIICK